MPANKRQTRTGTAPETASAAQNGISSYTMPVNASQNHANANASSGSYDYEQPATQERIGDLLRRMRERHRGNLQEIADYLRIKYSFLVALENSSYHEIPADAYVIGFLRTYAEFLGIDGKEAIDRYRKEMAGRRRKPSLIMPIPVGEGRAPSAMLIAGATVAALLIYVAWYGVSSSDRATVTPPPVIAAATQPNAELPATQTPPDLSLQTQPQQAQSAPPLDSTLAQAPTGVLLSQASTTTPATANADPNLQSGISVSGPAPAASNSALPAQTPPASTTATAPATGTAAPQQSAQEQQQPPTISTAAPQDQQASALAATTGTAPPQSASDAKPASRIVIRAEQTSWVLIVDSKGKTVYDKVMKAGNTYEVPDQPGLKMTTGNSGGLVLTIDGTHATRLPGDSSRILRNIPLDPSHIIKAQGSSLGTQE